MKDLTLREVCTLTGASRRAVQGYEQQGLVYPSGKNKYGHLLYDEKSQERIKMIYFYQQIGFSLKEISAVIDSQNSVRIKAVEDKIERLKKEGRKLEKLIQEAENFLKTLY